jgi:uncharacterized SAM-binding protein YcdF (DUF218 family)
MNTLSIQRPRPSIEAFSLAKMAMVARNADLYEKLVTFQVHTRDPRCPFAEALPLRAHARSPEKSDDVFCNVENRMAPIPAINILVRSDRVRGHPDLDATCLGGTDAGAHRGNHFGHLRFDPSQRHSHPSFGRVLSGAFSRSNHQPNRGHRSRRALRSGLTYARGPVALGSSGARATELVALAYKFPEARVAFSGGSADLLGGGISEADVAEIFFSQLGLPRDRVTFERKSRNTYENATFTRELLQPKPIENWVLVTSAFHMPRAVGAFKRAGFSVTPFPVDYFTFGDRGDYLRYTFSPIEALQLTDTAVKEWVGLTIYWLTGKTSEFLPRACSFPARSNAAFIWR